METQAFNLTEMMARIDEIRRDVNAGFNDNTIIDLGVVLPETTVPFKFGFRGLTKVLGYYPKCGCTGVEMYKAFDEILDRDIQIFKGGVSIATRLQWQEHIKMYYPSGTPIPDLVDHQVDIDIIWDNEFPDRRRWIPRDPADPMNLIENPANMFTTVFLKFKVDLREFKAEGTAVHGNTIADLPNAPQMENVSESPAPNQ